MTKTPIFRQKLELLLTSLEFLRISVFTECDRRQMVYVGSGVYTEFLYCFAIISETYGTYSYLQVSRLEAVLTIAIGRYWSLVKLGLKTNSARLSLHLLRKFRYIL